MATVALADKLNDEAAPSSPGSSSDTDSVNTAAARVYFGPLHAAEKKHARSSNSGHPTPLRRSKRHSRLASATPPRCLLSEEDEGTLSDALAEGRTSGQSGTDTPNMLDDILEEPSSALAKRVLRASENPSPPPSPPMSPVVIEMEELRATETPLPHSTEGTLDTGSTRSEHVPSNSFPPDSGPIAENAIPEVIIEDVDPVDPAEEADLINFDSFSAQTPSANPAVNLLFTTPPNASAGSHTVDDLLTISPLRPSLESSQEIQGSSLPLGGVSPHPEATPSPVDEAEVLIVLDDEAPPASLREPIDTLEAAPVEPEPVVMQLNPDPHTPLRRSTRPRRSVSPYIVPLTGTPSPRKSGLGVPSPNPIGQSPVVGPARKKGAKRKDIIVIEEDSEKLPTATSAEPSNGEISSTTYPVLSAPHTPLAHRSEAMRKPTHPSEAQLRSLSPESTNVLMQLLPSTPPKLDAEPEGQSSKAGEESAPNGPTGTFQRPNDATDPPFADAHVDPTPAGPSTPVRAPSSDISRDVGRTPARRVPIAEAFAQGTVSPHKPPTSMTHSSSFGLSTPVFKPRAPEDILRSPAKRIPISEVPQGLLGRTPSRPSSPAKPAPSRSMSAEPQPPLGPQHKRSMSAEPARPLSIRPNIFKKPPSVSSVGTGAQSGLPPFQLAQTIPEVDETEAQKHSKRPPPASRLPTGKVESRIPRPGSKPYARPTASGIPGPSKPSTTASSTLRKPTATTKTSTTAAPRPMRMVRKVVSKPIEVSSDSDSNPPRPSAGPGPKTVASRLAAATTTQPQSNLTPTLKRKREIEPPSKASPPGVKPVVVIRKVPPPPTKVSARAVPRTVPSSIAPRPIGPEDSPGPVALGKIRMRRVVDKKKKEPTPSPPAVPTPPEPPAPSAPELLKVDSPTDVVMRSPEPSPIAPTAPQALPSDPPSSSTPPEPLQSDPLEPEKPATEEKPPSPPPAEPDGGPASGLRRTSRTRKPPHTDVFGPAIQTGRSSSRRRATIILSDNTPFSGMTALALKSLTNTNTQRNQKQVAELQTEVIVKEGKRPDSPTTRVRTALEKQREERVLERQARAERRARRSLETDGEVPVDENGEDMSMEVDVEGVEMTPARHSLAPGDEEEYTTPERPAKRGRFELDEAAEAKNVNGKRVKWHRGLATTVYIDDSLPNPKKPKDVAVEIKKGCLALSAKTVRLDTMGNALNAEIPVPNLVVESIVVKKFVYEEEVAEAVPEPPPSPPPQPKATRSKGKKSQS